MSSPSTPAVDPPQPRHHGRLTRTRSSGRVVLPGLLFCLAAAGLSSAIALLLPGVSPLIIAIVLGVAAANLVRLPAVLSPGIDLAAKKLLRLGIVFLGLQVVLSDILDLGTPMLVVVVCIVAGGLLGTVALGRILRVPRGLSLLIACGFSICGAAAVAGAAGVTDPDDRAEEDTITAVALVVIFGTLMIPLVPVLADLLGLESESAGLWAGRSIHEIAQVVAAGGIIGGTGLTAAVIVKLARVLLLAPVMATLSIRQRRLGQRGSSSGQPGTAPDQPDHAPGQFASRTRLPPIVPPFVIGFIGMVLLRSFAPIPALALTAGSLVQTGLLAAAMFGLGCGVTIRSLARVGARPFALAALSTVLVAGIALLGVTIVGVL